MTKASLISALAALFLAGCAGQQFATYNSDTNYLTFNHPFTDKAAAEVASAADKLCRQRKQVAIQTTKACSLTQCTTHYQCMDEADVIKYGL